MFEYSTSKHRQQRARANNSNRFYHESLMYNSKMQAKLITALISRARKPFIQIYIVFVLVLVCWTAYNLTRFPFGVDYGEAPIMDQALRIELHQQLYRVNFNTPPYVISNYPPLYPATIAALNSTTGIPLFQAGRLVSNFFTLVSAVIIGWLAYHLTGRKLLGILASIIFLGNPYVLIWSSNARVDMMALGFSLLGLWAIYMSRSSKYWLIAAGVFFILSIYTRQTYLLAGPLAALAWLWHQNKRYAVYFTLSISAATLVIFGIINAITHGGFYANIIMANMNKYELSRTVQMLKQIFTFWPIIIIMSGIAFVMAVRLLMQNTKGGGDNNSTAFIVYGLGGYSVGAVVTSLTVGKVGSDVNYFLELITVCSIWCVIAIHFISDQRKSIKYIALGILSLQLIWVLVAGVTISRNVIFPKWAELANYNTIFTQVKRAAQQGTVLSDDYLDMVVLSGQSIYYQPFEYDQLFQAGLWDPSEFVSEIKNSSFPLILIGGTVDKPCCWPAQVAEAIRDSYTQTISGSFVIFTPKK